MLSFTFFIIFFFKKAEIKNQQKWPVVDCQDLTHHYNEDGLLKFAGYEYDELMIIRRKEESIPTSFSIEDPFIET
jgi:hypothetical protein